MRAIQLCDIPALFGICLETNKHESIMILRRPIIVCQCHPEGSRGNITIIYRGSLANVLGGIIASDSILPSAESSVLMNADLIHLLLSGNALAGGRSGNKCAMNALLCCLYCSISSLSLLSYPSFICCFLFVWIAT